MKYTLRVSVFFHLLLTVSLYTASAQGEKYPKLSVKGKNLKEFIPRHWKLIAQTVGDLNGDKIVDLAFVLQSTDKKNIVLNDGLGVDTLDSNPRILGIAFRDPASDNYELTLQSDTFILRHEDPVMNDPFDGVSVEKNGVLKISFRFWYSAGTWYMSTHDYKFRFQNSRFELIGYESSETHRATGETTGYSINFSTRKMHEIKENVQQEGPRSEKRTIFKLKELKTFDTLRVPFTWDFQGIIL